MKQELLTKYLSRPRYNRYLLATNNDKHKAQHLYKANIRLAQAIHPLLTQFEVILRNSLNEQLSSYFVDPNWIITQKYGFMKDASLSNSNYFLRRSIIKSEGILKRRKIPITSGKIISDQNFGFWLALFLSHHYALVKGQPIQVFKNKPNHEDRASIYSKLDGLRKFRNRVNHCEPLCFKGKDIDCGEILKIRKTLYNLVTWINPEIITFFQSIDNLKNEIENVSRI